jgi:hypothetical protein
LEQAHWRAQVSRKAVKFGPQRGFAPRVLLEMGRLNLLPTRTWIVMRQAKRTMFACVFLASLSVVQATGAGNDAAGTIAQAERLIKANDFSPAVALLEDLLAEAEPKVRPAILNLLRKSYDIMARDAKAAGRDREAAHYQDNLAIIEQCREVTTPPKPADPKTNKPAAPGPMTDRDTSSSGTTVPQPRPDSQNVPLPGSAGSSPPAIQAAAALAPEPAKSSTADSFPVAPNPLDVPSSPSPGSTALPSLPSSMNNQPARDEAVSAMAAPTRPEPTGSADPSSTRAVAGAVAPADIPTQPAGPSLADGDRLFASGRYAEAGQCYAALADLNRLPAHRQAHWAYCRMVDVARRINARPKTPGEWDEIAAEIVKIQRLTPNNWYGEYLRNKVAEVRNGGRRTPPKSDNLIVRSAASDDSQKQVDPETRRFPRLFGRSRAATPAPGKPSDAPEANNAELPLNLPQLSTPPQPASRPISGGADLDSTGAQKADRSSATSDPAVELAVAQEVSDNTTPWQVLETPNFRIFHHNARLAEAAGQTAESVRAVQAKRWKSPALQRPWTPPCELYLYATGKVFAQETKQPESSAGFSTMMCNGNRVVARRTNLRADHPQVLTAILPHEVTHVVLADLFTVQQIPRWADEGMAVLAEPRAEQQVRAAELHEPLEAGRIFDLSKLMAMDYPAAKDWSLYYAQSVSLTRFLVEQGPPEQFVQFVHDSQRDGIESALQSVYRIGGFPELQERWIEYARRHTNAVVSEARREPKDQGLAAELK